MSHTARRNPSGTPAHNHQTPSGFSPELRPDTLNPLVSEYDQGACPDHLVTRRRLRDRGLCPGRGPGAAILRCKACWYTPQQSCMHCRRAWFYDLAVAKPKRVPTLAQEWGWTGRWLPGRPDASAEGADTSAFRLPYCIECNTCSAGPTRAAVASREVVYGFDLIRVFAPASG